VRIDFTPSARSTLGIEWELALVDRDSGELAPHAPAILETLKNDDPETRMTAEFLTNTVEVVSGVHERVTSALDDLRGCIDLVTDASAPFDVDLMCAGTHPFSSTGAQQITDKERYATLLDRTQWWGRQLLIWGVHVHVGIDSRDKALPILDGLLPYYPHFQALSASSPYWQREATGYASSRAMLFQQLPTAGLPPQFTRWDQYERMVADLVHTGVIDDHSEMRWDIRPAPQWGTLENRIADGLPTIREVGAIAALAQCLVDDLSQRIDDGEEIQAMQPWFVRENKWRAARYGLEAIIIQNPHGDESLVTDDTRALITRLEPAAERLGCLEQLHDVEVILDRGASYQRQLDVAARNGGDLRAVVSSLVAEFRNGEPA
jgi:carboxylate-amine ligase